MNQKQTIKLHLLKWLQNNKNHLLIQRFGLLNRQNLILQQIGRSQSENQKIFIIQKRSFADFFTTFFTRFGIVSKSDIFPDLGIGRSFKKEEIRIFSVHPEQSGAQQGVKDSILLNFPLKQPYSYVPIQIDSLNQLRRKRNI